MKIALLGFVTFAVYLIAALLLGLRLQRPPRENDSVLAIQVPALFALFSHGLLLVNQFLQLGLNFGFFNSLALFAWIITALLIFGSLRWPLMSLGIMVYPISGLCAVALGVYSSQQPAGATQALSGALELHIVISVFAYSLLSLAGLQSIVLAVQDHQLHNHKPGGFVRSLPPLQVMERLMFRMITVGFCLLTLSLASGFYVAENLATHKNIFSIIAWLIFAVLLIGRWQAGWRGRKAIRLTLAGIAFLMLAFFGSKLVVELILGR